MADDFDFSALEKHDEPQLDFSGVEAPAKQTAIAAVGANPDVAAKAIDLGKKLNVPPVAVEQDPDTFQRQHDMAVASDAMTGSPFLQQYVQSDPMAAKVSSDDWGLLKRLSAALQIMQSMAVGVQASQKALDGKMNLGTDEIGAGIKQGMLEQEKGGLIQGQVMGGGKVSSPRVDEIKKQLDLLPQGDSFGKSVGAFIGSIIPSLTATGVGAGAGAVFPAVGPVAGGMTGFATDQARRAYGNQVDAMTQRGVSLQDSRLLALPYAVAVGAVNMIGEGKIVEGGQMIARSILDRAMSKVTDDPAMLRMFATTSGKIAKGGILGSLLFGTQEFARKTNEDFAVHLADPNAKTLYNDPAELDKAADGVLSTMWDGLRFGAVMSALPIGVSRIADAQKHWQTALNAKNISEVLAARDQTRTFQRSPELIQNFIQAHDISAPLGLDPNKVLEIHKDNPGAFSFIPDVENKAQAAIESGTDLKVSAADYLSNISPQTHFEIKDDLRYGEGLTPNEVKEMKENPPDYPEVFHGTPFERENPQQYFDDLRFMSGEGNNTYGQGHYVTEHPGIAEFYKDSITGIHSKNEVYIGGELRDLNRPDHLAAQAVHDFDGDIEAAKRTGQRDLSYAEGDKAELEDAIRNPDSFVEHDKSKLAGVEKDIQQLKAVLELLEHPENIPQLEYRAGNDLFPHVAQGRIKATPEELSDLRKSPAEQNEKTKAAIAQVEKEGGNHPEFRDHEGAKYPDYMTMKEWLSTADKIVGPDRVRQIFIENGIKAHKYETSQSQGKGGEVVRDGKFIQNEELTDKERRADYLAANIRDLEQAREHETESGKTALDAEIAKIQKEIDSLGGAPERQPAHNYVLLEGKNFELTHINGVEVKVPEEVLADPHASAIYQQVADSTATEIGIQERALAVDGLFKDAQAAGMTKVQYALYAKHIEAVRAADTEKVFQTAEREAKRRLTQEWKDNFNEMRPDVEEELSQRPEFMAIKYLRLGETPEGTTVPRIGLDRKATEEMLGAYEGNRADYPAVGDLPDRIFTKDGLHPDDIASLFGYSSGHDLLVALRDLREEKELNYKSYQDMYDKMVNAETVRRMEEKYGRVDDKTEMAAQEAALNTVHRELISQELDFLREKAGVELPIDKDELRSKARDLFEDQAAIDNRTKGWMDGAGKWGRRAEMFLLKGDYVAAFQAKQTQMLHLMVADFSRQFDAVTKDLAKRVERFSQNVTLQKVDIEYHAQIQKLLQSIGFEVNAGDLSRFTDDLPTFAKKVEDQARDMYVAPHLLTPDPNYAQQGLTKPFAKYTIGEVMDLQKTLKSMEFNGRAEKTLTTAIGELEFQDAIDRAMGSLNASGEIWDPKSVGPVRSQLRAWDASLVRAERLLDWLDHNREDGIFNDAGTRNIQAAAHAREDLKQTFGKKVAALRKAVGDKFFSDAYLDQQLANTTLMDLKSDGSKSDKPYSFTRRELRSVMLNMGNEVNFRKLLDGYGWEKDQFLAFVNEHATAGDIAVVNGLHDIMNDLKPHVYAMIEKRFGVAPEPVQARPMSLTAGELKGGYFPLIGDGERGRVGGSRQGLFDDDKFLNLGKPSFARARTGAVYPLDLTAYDTLGYRLEQSIHFATMTDALEQAWKFFSDNRVYQGISEKFGREYADSLKDWIATEAQSKSITDQQLSWAHTIARRLRINAVYADIGLNLGTIMKHGFTLFSHSMAEVNPVSFAKNLAKFITDPVNIRNKLMEESGELRSDARGIDRDLRKQMTKLSGKGDWQDALLAWTTRGVNLSDAASRYPVYMTAKAEGLARGLSEEDAIYHAEKTVRNSHGGTKSVDLPAMFKSNNEFLRAFTMFGNVWNHMYNQTRDLGRDVHSSSDITNMTYNSKMDKFWKVSQRSMFLLIIPTIVDGMLTHGAPGDKDSKVGWFGGALAAQLGGMIPFISQITRAVGYSRPDQKTTIGTPAGFAMLDAVAQNLANAKQKLTSGKAPKSWLKDAAMLPAYGLGIPIVQPQKSLRYLWEQGNAYHPDNNAIDWMRGLMFGPKPKKGH